MIFRNFLLAIGLFALFTGAVLFVFWLMQSPSKNLPRAAGSPSQQSILVAARPIAAGTLLRAQDIQWKSIEATDVPDTYLVRGHFPEREYAGAVAKRDFAAEEPLVAASLLLHSDRGFLAAVLAPGKRAISIAVDAPQSAAGMILPGDCVDVILTQRLDDSAVGAARRAVGETVLQNLRVVAVDQSLSASTRPGPNDPRAATVESRIPRTITLEVSEQEAEKLLVAAELGKIVFSVRAAQEDAAVPQNENARSVVWATDVSQAFVSSPRVLGARSSGQSRASVEVVHGSKIEH